MKYLVIIYGNDELWASFSEEDTKQHIAKQDAWNKKYAESGELLGAYGLGGRMTAKVIANRDGVPAVTDGPYIDAKEYVGSFYLIDVADEARAVEISAEIPFASYNSVEMWPLLHGGSADEL